MKWFFVFLVFFGDALIIFKNRWGFFLWIICDGFFAINSFREGRIEETIVFAFYSLLGMIGYWKWGN